MALVPEKDWIDLAHILIHHGRAICSARAPKCDDCVVLSHCPKIDISPPARDGREPSTRRPLKERIAAARKK